MKLLFLLPSVPDPPDAGAKIRNLGLLRLAAADYEVDAIAFGSAAEAPRLAALTRRSAVVPPPPRRTTPARLADMLTSARLPDMALRLWSSQFLQQLHRLLASEHYDAVQAEGIEMARYLRAVLPSRADGGPARVYDAHNAEFLLQRLALESAVSARQPRSVPAALYSLVQWRRLTAFEREIVATCDLTLAVSHHDANQLEALSLGAQNVQVVPNGIEVERYPFQPPEATDPANLLFLGKLDYRPNAAALRWLVDHVLPPLLDRVPGARLWVVGANPPNWLVRVGQQSDRVAVVGHVPDERPYLQRAAILLLPMRAGGGSRLKALVAMASGVPILSTLFGMEGLEAVAGTHYLQADSPADWLDSAAELLGDPARRARLAAAGRRLVEEHYDWPCIKPKLETAYSVLALSRGQHRVQA